jgi:MFS family permease
VSTTRFNLPTLQVLALLFMFDLTVPLRQTLYSQSGLGQAAIGVIFALPWIIILLADVPTGRLADEYSYKKMVTASGILLAASFALLALAQSFEAFLASAALLGLGGACWRGVPNALSSLTIGSLHDPSAAQRYKRFVRWSLAIAAIGEAAASVTTWLILQHYVNDGLRLVAWLQVGICLLMALTSHLFLTDIRPDGVLHKGFAKTVLSGWGLAAGRVREVFRSTPLVRAIVLYGAVIGCTTQTMVWLSQTYLQRSGTPTEDLPAIWLVYHLALFGFTFLIVPYEKLLGRWGALASLPALAAATYGALMWVQPAYGKWLVLAFYFIRAMQMGIITVYLMTLVPESMRATMAAVMSTVQFTLYSVMSLAINASVQILPSFQYGTGVAFGLSAAVYGTLGLVLVWRIRKHSPISAA